MENEITIKIQEISLQEQALEKEIDEKEEAAYRALGDLHEAIERLYILKKGEKAVLNSANEFIETVMDKVFKIDVEGLGHKQNEVRQALETALWGINKALDLYKDIEYTIKRGSAD